MEINTQQQQNLVVPLLSTSWANHMSGVQHNFMSGVQRTHIAISSCIGRLLFIIF